MLVSFFFYLLIRLGSLIFPSFSYIVIFTLLQVITTVVFTNFFSHDLLHTHFFRRNLRRFPFRFKTLNPYKAKIANMVIGFLMFSGFHSVLINPSKFSLFLCFCFCFCLFCFCFCSFCFCLFYFLLVYLFVCLFVCLFFKSSFHIFFWSNICIGLRLLGHIWY